MTDFDQQAPGGDGPLPTHSKGHIGNSGMVKKVGFIAALCFIGYLGYTFYQEGKNEEKPKSDAETALDKIRTKQQKTVDGAAQAQAQKPKIDQALGDPEDLKKLEQIRAEKEAAKKAEEEALDAAQAEIEQLNYQRKIMLLPHDPALAQKWQDRQNKAAATGQNLVSRRLTEAEEKILEGKNPALLASLKRLRSQGGQQVASKPGAPTGKVAGIPGPQGGVPLPNSIDPKTGLPLQGAPGAVAGGGSWISGLRPDGTPDIEGGAIPITYQYTPVGQKEPVNVVQWVKPGYLIGRSRPYNPAELVEADRQYRAALRAPTEFNEKETSPVVIPYRVAPSKGKASGDFVFQQRYVVVMPNPNGVLTPPNPPAKK